MTISSDDFKNALSLFASGVTIVTSTDGERRHGMTASAFMSVSAAPPLITVAIDQAHGINPLLDQQDACFAVSLLTAGHEELSNRFAFEKDEDRFLAGDWQTATTGAPVLADALAWLDCRLAARHPAGSHTLVVGEVVASAVPNPSGAPLLYWNRGYQRL